MHRYPLNTTRLKKLLSDLIRINSVNPSLAINRQGESGIARYVGNYLKDLGVSVNYQTLKTNRVNVIAKIPGQGGGPSLLLNGHTDTVGVDRMAIDPFEPKFENGKMYGRGSLDMKSGIAAQIMAVETLLESGITLKGDLILTFVCDEEYASIGTEETLKTLRVDAAIICEPTHLELMIAHKGFAWARIEVFGRAAHGSLPEEGIDAIVKAGRLLTRLETLSRRKLSTKQHPLLGSPSLHASLIQGGTELSTYPDYCKIELERRTLPGEDRSTVERELQKLIHAAGKNDPCFHADLDVFFYRPAYEISRDQPIVRSMSRAVRETGKCPLKYSGMGGWIESALLAGAGIPTVIFGPSGEGLHAAVEYVDFDSVVTTAEILIRTLCDYCGVVGQ
ncbi:MAG TPA: ArgE/DapE family deacylase [bacterium]|nr:ArgE/DapE family deacylase [bacterium]